MNVLHRDFGLREIKFDAGDSELMTFTGYGAVFGNMDSYGDVIEPGAFAETLRKAKSSDAWPAMLLQHGGWEADSQTPIGVWAELQEDEKGLAVKGQLAPTQRGREAYELLKMQPRPAITGLSIGYRPIEWESRSKPEDPRRRLKKVDAIDSHHDFACRNGPVRRSMVQLCSDLYCDRRGFGVVPMGS